MEETQVIKIFIMIVHLSSIYCGVGNAHAEALVFSSVEHDGCY